MAFMTMGILKLERESTEPQHFDLTLASFKDVYYTLEI